MSLEKIYSYHLLELYSFIWKYSTFEIFIFAIYLLFAITKNFLKKLCIFSNFPDGMKEISENPHQHLVQQPQNIVRVNIIEIGDIDVEWYWFLFVPVPGGFLEVRPPLQS